MENQYNKRKGEKHDTNRDAQIVTVFAHSADGKWRIGKGQHVNGDIFYLIAGIDIGLCHI